MPFLLLATYVAHELLVKIKPNGLKVCMCGIPMDCPHHQDCRAARVTRLPEDRPADCPHRGKCPAVDNVSFDKSTTESVS